MAARAAPDKHRQAGRAPAVVRRARHAIADARADDVFLYSAALAFYGLISVAPLVVVALWITSLVVGPTQVHHVADDLARLAPPALGADQALEHAANLGTTLGLAAVAAALWPATAYGSALVKVLDRVTGDHEATGVRGRGVALLLVAVIPVMMLGSLVASYAGTTVLGGGGAKVIVGLALAVAAGFVVAVATVAMIYRRFPRTPPDRRPTVAGAFTAAGCISVLSAAYVTYLRFGANFEDRYASAALASVVLLGLWLFAVNVALLVGYRVAAQRHLLAQDAGQLVGDHTPAELVTIDEPSGQQAVRDRHPRV